MAGDEALVGVLCVVLFVVVLCLDLVHVSVHGVYGRKCGQVGGGRKYRM